MLKFRLFPTKVCWKILCISLSVSYLYQIHTIILEPKTRKRRCDELSLHESQSIDDELQRLQSKTQRISIKDTTESDVLVNQQNNFQTPNEDFSTQGIRSYCIEIKKKYSPKSYRNTK